METGRSKPSKRCACAKRKLNDVLMLVSPSDSGKGLPYAAVDWPNPGDIWGWKLGRRIRKSGVYQDSYLIAPESLQERPNSQVCFGSKLSVELFGPNFLMLTSMHCIIHLGHCSKSNFSKKGKFTSSPKTHASQEEKCGLKRADGIFIRTRKSALGQTSEESADKFVIELTLDAPSVEKGPLASGTTTKGFKDGKVSISHAAAAENGRVYCSPVGCKFDALKPLEEPGLTSEEFDNYLDALDEMLTLPLPRDQASSKSEGVPSLLRTFLIWSPPTNSMNFLP